jgi:phage tail tape-measure protein
MLKTSTTVGTSILGAITGQMLIPIPIVGALIGSVIGGFIGDRGGKQVSSWFEKKKFLETINYLHKSQLDEKYWLCTP